MLANVDLVALLRAQLYTYHVAMAACPLPPPSVPLTWIVAANGTFLRGTNPTREVIVQVDRHPSVIPGLVPLHPSVVWLQGGTRLPGRLLLQVLSHARQAVDGHGHPVEQQYWITDRGAGLTVIRPPQRANAVQVITPRSNLPILVDIHSHHGMDATFSSTDDHDDALQLGVSVVIGTIWTQPTLRVRLCVYGYTEEVPATSVFTEVGPFRDVHRGGHHERP